MGKPTPTLEAEIKALRDAYAALNRGDVAGMVKDFDPRIERIEPTDSPHGGTYRGLAAVMEHISKARATWAEGGCEPERFIVVPAKIEESAAGSGGRGGDRIVVFVRVRVRLKAETEWREGRTTDVYTFRNGKAIQFRTFWDQREGLEWAGVKESEAH